MTPPLRNAAVCPPRPRRRAAARDRGDVQTILIAQSVPEWQCCGVAIRVIAQQLRYYEFLLQNVPGQGGSDRLLPSRYSRGGSVCGLIGAGGGYPLPALPCDEGCDHQALGAFVADVLGEVALIHLELNRVAFAQDDGIVADRDPHHSALA